LTRRADRIAIPLLTFALTLALRVHGISRNFAMLRDQIRDWEIALGPFSSLPLVGPATHVGGYTIGPAFYWILWAIRVVVGPWFANLPHGGGIGQAIVQSGADALLLVAIWRRTGSVWIALATIILLATAAHDLALAALVWNPMMGSALAKIATALVLIGWPSRSITGAAVTTAVAWAAVHSYTGAIFTSIGVLMAIVAGPLIRGDRTRVLRSAAAIAAVVVAMQVPYLVYRLSPRSGPAMAAVAGSVERILTGEVSPDFRASWDGFRGAFTFIQGAPWHQHTWIVWILVLTAAIVLFRYRRDAELLSVTVFPLALAVFGYGFFVGNFFDPYYYFSLMPAAVLTVVLGLTAMPSPATARGVAICLVIAALAITPARLHFAAAQPHMPEYGPLVDGSRQLVERRGAIRAIRTEFALPPSADPEFLYRILGGRFDPSSRIVAVITREGQVVYRAE
jgi:hypothetical protein